jgi:hypothetical protein
MPCCVLGHGVFDTFGSTRYVFCKIPTPIGKPNPHKCSMFRQCSGCTICRMRAEDDSKGFLAPRPLGETNFQRRRGLRFPVKSADGHRIEIYLLGRYSRYKPGEVARATKLYQSDVGRSVLANRGWIFQEQVVARRRLHFGKHQMYWVCRETSFAEDGTSLHLYLPGWPTWSNRSPPSPDAVAHFEAAEEVVLTATWQRRVWVEL